MTIADETWQRWIAALEDMLHEADIHREHKLGIHINAAILAAHAALGTERGVPRHDDQPD